MTGLDWIIVAVVVLFAAFGFQQGFLVGALTLAGFLGGAVAGSRLAPELLAEGSASPYAPLLALTGAVLVGSVLAAGLELLARRLRARLTLPGLGIVDGALGALLIGALALALAWLGGAVALQIPGTDVRRDIQRSAILATLNEALPPSGPILNALARFDPLPSVRGPRADVPAPPPGVASDPDIRAAAGSVVRIRGTACGLGVTGSGYVAAPNLVVTNAHVVAGQSDTVVQSGGRQLPAQAVAFDERNDVAVLRVPGLQAPALPFAPDVDSGTPGAILGYPLNGPFDARPARVGATTSVITQDAYGQGPVTRKVTVVRGRVRSGNSGGPVVDRQGRVVGTVFAAATGGGPRSGYAVPNAVVQRALRSADGPVGTGPCTR